MSADLKTPKSLTEAIALFSDADTALRYGSAMRWPDGVRCPDCGCEVVYFLKTQRRWKCSVCKRQFTVKTGTIMEDSALSLGKWLTAMWIQSNSKNGVSSHELGRSLGITQKSAWFMEHRIREAWKAGTIEKLSGIVEVDETFIGAKAERMNKAARKSWEARKETERATGGKTAVFTAVERDGDVIARRIPDTTRSTLHAAIGKTIEPGATIYTDENAGYDKLNGYEHDAVNHADGEHVRGAVHTQNADCYHNLFKRCIRGTWVNVSPQHINRYLREQDFRYNERKGTDGERFVETAKSIGGKRLTYKALTARRTGRGPQKGFDWRKKGEGEE